VFSHFVEKWNKHSRGFLHPVPVCMQFCKCYDLFLPALSGLLFQKAEQVFKCMQDVCVHLHQGPWFILIIASSGLLGECSRLIGTDVNSKGKIPLNRRLNRWRLKPRLEPGLSGCNAQCSNHQAFLSSLPSLPQCVSRV